MADRVVIGRGRNTGGSGYGLWVSNPGYDVKTCDPEHLAFSSDHGGFGQVMAKGRVTVQQGAPQTVDVPCPANAKLMPIFYPIVGGWLGTRAIPVSETVFVSSMTFPVSTTCRVQFNTTLNSNIVVAYTILFLGFDT